MNKIEMIQRSNHCLVLGWWSLVPVLGFPFAIGALIDRRRVRKASRGQWNPAATHLRLGAALACLGCAISLVAAALVAAAVANN
jgi:hypothetical protein